MSCDFHVIYTVKLSPKSRKWTYPSCPKVCNLSLPNLRPQRFSPRKSILFIQKFIALPFTFKSMMHFELKCKMWIEVHVFAMDIQLFQHHLLIGLSSVYCTALHHWQNLVVHIYTCGLFLNSLFCSIDLFVSFDTSTTLSGLL